jgi:hypothetical protein
MQQRTGGSGLFLIATGAIAEIREMCQWSANI